MIIQVKDRTLSTTSAEQCISDNSDYKISFVFDEEWEGVSKTVRFISGKQYKDVLVDAEDECVIPLEVLNPGILKIGVFSSEYATTELFVNVKGSVLQSVAKQIDYISEDIYRQLLEKIDSLQAGEVSQEQISEAVAQYMKENPVTGGVSQEELEAAVKEYLTANPPEAEVTTEEIANAVSSYMEVNAEDFKGEPGEDGVSPTVAVEEITGGHRVTITDIHGGKTFDVLDGAGRKVTEEELANAIEGYLKENPLEMVTDEQIQEAVNAYLEENPVESSETDTLKGKKILFIGDSICEGVGANGQPYPYWIEQWHKNTTVYNLGVAGMTIAQKDETITNSMPVRIASKEFENAVYSDVDIIVFEGGINDLMNNVKLGYIKKIL